MRLLSRVILLVAVLGLPSVACADTGQLRDIVTANGLNVVVFTSPTPLRAGEVEVAVLVTDAETGAPLRDFELTVAARHASWSPDSLPMQIGGEPDPGNRLAQKAVFELPETGRWQLLLRVQHDGKEVEVALSVDAGERMPRWWQVLPVALIGLPFAALVVIRDRLRHPA